jgi:hypothetical protein
VRVLPCEDQEVFRLGSRVIFDCSAVSLQCWDDEKVALPSAISLCRRCAKRTLEDRGRQRSTPRHPDLPADVRVLTTGGVPVSAVDHGPDPDQALTARFGVGPRRPSGADVPDCYVVETVDPDRAGQLAASLTGLRDLATAA